LAKKKKDLEEKEEKSNLEDFTADLIKSLNKESGTRVAYNLSVDESPTHVSRWISTGSIQLDYIIANQSNGGLPEGRIVEIFGPPSIGKSHIATQIAKSTQKLGGIVVYIDTENATSVDNLKNLGVNISKRFIYVDTHCTEEVLSIAERTIIKAKAMDKDVPVTIIWDSVAATSPKAELIGEYDKDSIGLQARAISKGMRKITGVIANEKVLFVCLNQIRSKVGVLYGDPTCIDPETEIEIEFDENSLFNKMYFNS
jgi:recombination protein RecA